MWTPFWCQTPVWQSMRVSLCPLRLCSLVCTLVVQILSLLDHWNNFGTFMKFLSGFRLFLECPSFAVAIAFSCAAEQHSWMYQKTLLWAYVGNKSLWKREGRLIRCLIRCWLPSRPRGWDPLEPYCIRTTEQGRFKPAASPSRCCSDPLVVTLHGELQIADARFWECHELRGLCSFRKTSQVSLKSCVYG